MATIASSSDSMFVRSAATRLGRNEAALSTPTHVATAAQSAIDARLMAIIDAPLDAGDTAFAGYHKKEIQLVGIMCRLTVLEARALHARLGNPRASDELATKFMRLTIERRYRLLNFLADARRRAALERK